jgi:hypothetical protein
MTPEKINTSTTVADDEIDLLALALTLWEGRRIIILSILICGILGIIKAIYSPNEYVASAIVVPSETYGTVGLGDLSGLKGLAEMAGFSGGDESKGEVSPILYPKILSSLPFQLELIKTPLNFDQFSEPITFIDYYTKNKKPNLLLKYTLGLPGVIMQVFKKKEPAKIVVRDENEPLELTAKQLAAIQTLSGLLSLEVNVKEGFLTLSAKMPEARAAAQLGQRAQELLQQFITDFKSIKAKSNLKYIQNRYNEKAQSFLETQKQLATFRDRNINVSSATAKTEEERLTAMFNLSYGINFELAKQVEQAKIKVEQNTPVFTVIEPITVPTKSSGPKRQMILFISLFLGGIIGTGMVFGKEFVNSIKERWHEEKEKKTSVVPLNCQRELTVNLN